MRRGESYSQSLFSGVILISAIAILLNQPIYDTLTSIGWVEAIYKDLKPNFVYDICAMLVIIAGCFISDNAASKMDSNTAYKSLAVLTPIIVLLICFRWNYSSIYTPFYLLPDLKYVDVSLAILLFHYIECLNHLERKETDISKLPDKENNNDTNLLFDDNDATDILGRDASAKRLAKLLVKENNKTGAFGVAVTGGWGSGKSWYLNALKKELTNKYNGTCIDFKPWVYDVKELTPTFCKLLENSLVGEGVDTDDLKALITELLKSAGGISTISSYFLGIGKHNPSRQELIENVKSDLKEAKKPIFVFMDECDRLSKEELLQVFSLIRNVCDFPYLCYILSYDKDKVGDILKGSGGLEYAAKMIDLPIHLEPITNAVIINQLCDMFKNKVDIDDVKEKLERIDFTNYIHTLRQFNRFWNVIYGDLIRQQEIFAKLFISETDWVILELIKYKDSELYTLLRDNPGVLLATSNKSWNSPAWFYNKQNDSKYIKYKELLKFLFPEEIQLSDDKLFGVANKTWSIIYFSNNLPSKFRDCNDYVNSINNGTFVENIVKWTKAGDKGLIYVIAYALSALNETDTLKSLVDYIWASCDNYKGKYITTLGSYYSNDDAPHSYWFIQTLITQNPIFGKIFFQVFSSYEDSYNGNGDRLEYFVKNTDRPLELTALMLHRLHKIDSNDDVEFWDIEFYFPILFNRLISQTNKQKIDIFNIFEILYDCSLEDTYPKYILPLLKDNPQMWLGTTIKIKKEKDDKEYLLLDSKLTHAIFGKVDNVRPYLSQLEDEVSSGNRQLIKDYARLFKSLNENIQLVKDQKGIELIYIKPSILDKKEYAGLTSALKYASNAFTPIEPALRQLSETTFWKDEDLRIKRGESQLYFGQNL